MFESKIQQKWDGELSSEILGPCVIPARKVTERSLRHQIPGRQVCPHQPLSLTVNRENACDYRRHTGSSWKLHSCSRRESSAHKAPSANMRTWTQSTEYTKCPAWWTSGWSACLTQWVLSQWEILSQKQWIATEGPPQVQTPRCEYARIHTCTHTWTMHARTPGMSWCHWGSPESDH